MTVTTEVSESSLYSGDGSTNAWPFSFKVTAANELVLFVTDSAGIETEVTSGFSVSGLNQAAGGTVTYPTDSTRLQVGQKIRVVRRPPLLQPLALTNDVNLYRQLIENQLDRSVFIDQWLRTQVNRSIRLRSTSTISNVFLPDPEAGKAIGWNEAGTGLANIGELATGGGGAELHDLVDDGTTDQAAELEALIAAAIEAGDPELRITGATDGSSAIRIDRRIRVYPSSPISVVFSRVTLIAGKGSASSGEFFITGSEVELPETGKARLWADVDVSGSPVTAFDIDVRNNPDIVDLLTTGARIIIRGENGPEGEALEGHKHETTVSSLVEVVADERYTLTIADALPTTVGSTWFREWADSDWTDPDETLISVLAAAPLTANATDTDTVTIAAGRAAALGLVAGSWVQVLDDATGSDFHGTSNEPLHRQMVRVAQVTAGSPDTIRFDEPIWGALTTANAARLVMLEPGQPIRFIGPGPAFPVRRLGTPDASPARRGHFIETRSCIRPEVSGWCYEYAAADGYQRGAIIRDSISFEPWIHGNVIRGGTPDFAPALNSGDCYGIWLKGATGALVENNITTGGRHGIVGANVKRSVIRDNLLGLSSHQNLDLHGENERDCQLYGNAIVRGPKWADRARHIAVQLGNQTHTYGTKGAALWGNAIHGFDDADDVGYLVVSGADDFAIDLARHENYGTLVSVDADSRAPDVLIRRGVITGVAGAGTTGVLIDGRMQVWESEGEVSGSASRPIYIDDDTGTRRYVTEDTGVLGTVNPTHTTGTTASGDIDLEYVGPVADETIPIQGVKVLGELSQAGTAVTQYRASSVLVQGLVIDEDDMASEDATRPPSQQSVVAYVAEQVGRVPPGVQAIITRDDTGALVAAEAPGDGTIVIDEDGVVSAKAILPAKEFEIVEVTASRNLTASDVAFDTTTPEGEATRAKERVLLVEATSPSDPVVLTIPNNCPTLSAVNILVSGAQTGLVTLVVGDAGSINGVDEDGGGEATVTIEPERIFVLQNRNPDLNAPAVTTSATVEDGKIETVTSVSGTLTLSAHLGRRLVSSGNITVPNVPGFWCIIVGGGAHTITHNSLTSAAVASGDLVPLIVGPSNAIDAVRILAADKLAFA